LPQPETSETPNVMDLNKSKFDITGSASLINFGVINNATINAADAGLVAFVAPTVVNDGVINAKLGRVALASGDRVTVDLNPGNPLVEVALNARQSAALLENDGVINAQGGTVQMTADTARGIVNNVINMDGVIDVTSVSQKNGKIILGGGNANVNVKGKLTADGGGSVDVQANNVTVDKNAVISATGTGGSIRFMALSNGYTSIRLPFIGTVPIVNGRGSYNGTMTAGSKVETSATTSLLINKDLKVTAADWLIDPINIAIDSDMAIAIMTALNANTNTTVLTSAPGLDAGDITLNQGVNITWNSAAFLKLAADNNIIVNGNIASNFVGGTGSEGAIILDAKKSIFSQFTSGDAARSLTTQSGNIALKAGDDITLAGGNTAGSGVTITSTDGDISFDAGKKLTFANNATVGNNPTLIKTINGDINLKSGGAFEMSAGNLANSGVTVQSQNGDVNVDAGSVRIVNDTTSPSNLVRIAAGDDITIKSAGTFTVLGQMADASVESNGGDIVIDNKGVYTATANSVRTKGTGTVDVNQVNGGSLQNAIDSILNTGSGLNTLHAFAGNYAENINIDMNNFLLSGVNAGIDPNTGIRVPEAVITAVSGASPAVRSANNKVKIDGVKIVGGTDGVFFTGDNVAVENSIISNQSGNGVVFDGVENGKIAHNKIESLGQDGARLINSDKITVSSNTIGSLGDDGIETFKTNNLVIKNNKIGNLGDTGIYLETGNDADVEGNEIYNLGGNGIFARNIDTLDITKKNIIRNLGRSGISATRAKNINVDDNDIFELGKNGIHITSFDNATINNNDVYNTGEYGVIVQNPKIKTDITGNRISNVGLDGVLVNVANIVNANGNTIKNAGDGIDDGAIVLRAVQSAVVDNNDIDKTGFYGISADGVNKAVITNNKINATGASGIFSRNSKSTDGVSVVISGNTVTNTGSAGIYLTKFLTANVIDNTVDTTGSFGIWAVGDFTSAPSNTDNSRLLIQDNTISNNRQNAIRVNNVKDINITENTGTNTRYVGMLINGFDTASITKNTVTNTGRSGVDIRNGVTSLLFKDNTVSAAAGDGVYISNVKNATVKKNTVFNTRDDGIETVNLVGADIVNNTVYGTGDDGIVSSGGSDLRIARNTVRNLRDDGIFVSGATDVDIKNNEVYSLGGDGIETSGASDVEIESNNVYFVGRNGISSANGENVTVTLNTVRDLGGDGIAFNNINDSTISNNTVRDLGGNGISTNGGNGVTINGANDVRRVGKNGISSDGTDNLVVQNNEVRSTGMNGIYAANAGGISILDNLVRRSGDNGIFVANSYGYEEVTPSVLIQNNDVANTDENGILVSGFSTADILDNKVAQADGNGIEVNGFGGKIMFPFFFGDFGYEGAVNVVGNTIDNSDQNGILVGNVYKARIRNNTVDQSGWDGINLYNFDIGRVRDNTVTRSDDDGISVSNGVDAVIRGNTVNRSGDDGIRARNINSREYPIYASLIAPIDEDGGLIIDDIKRPRFTESRLRIIDNNVTNSGDDGIDVSDSFDVLIRGNNVDRSGDDGIAVSDIYDRFVYPDFESEGPFFISFEGDSGDFYSPSRLRVINNTVDRSGDDGIDIAYAQHVEVRGNDVNRSGFRPVITGDEELSFIFDGDYERDDTANGIIVVGAGGYWNEDLTAPEASSRGGWDLRVLNNRVRNSEDNGIAVSGYDDADIINNRVRNSGDNGLYVFGPRNGNVNVEENIFTDNDIGAQFESGLIDLTGVGNEFINGRVGLRFSPYQSPFMEEGDDVISARFFGEEVPKFLKRGGPISPLQLVDNDGPGVSPPSQTIPTNFGGTIGEQLFDGQTLYFVELANGAFFNPGSPTWLNALNSTYRMGDGTLFRPSTTGGVLNRDQFAFLESRFFHFADDASLGRFFFGFVPEIDQEDIFNQFGPAAFGAGNVRVTILGLPRTGAAGVGADIAGFLNNLAPFAGGEGNDVPQDVSSLTPEMLNQIEAAAGGNATGPDGSPTGGGASNSACWIDAAVGAQQGQVTTYSFGSQLGMSDIEQENNCANQ
jgi:trimeric autotransporter adhesin